MTKDEALQMCLEYIETDAHERKYVRHAIKAALEAKDEPANDELHRLHDLLGKANALARIRANKIDELEQQLTKTEAQLGEAVWNYGEVKSEQLANQQKTSGSPINTSAALEAKDEPAAWMNKYGACKTSLFRDVEAGAKEEYTIPLYTTPPQRKPLTDEELLRLLSKIDECTVRLPRGLREFARAIEAVHGITGENT